MHALNLAKIFEKAPFFVSTYPNAGLPNEFGGYDETPDSMCEHIEEWCESGLVNIIGGCCGTDPHHISHFVEAAEKNIPRKFGQQQNLMKTLENMAPILNNAKGTLENMNLPNMDKVQELMSSLQGGAKK